MGRTNEWNFEERKQKKAKNMRKTAREEDNDKIKEKKDENQRDSNEVTYQQVKN